MRSSLSSRSKARLFVGTAIVGLIALPATAAPLFLPTGGTVTAGTVTAKLGTVSLGAGKIDTTGSTGGPAATATSTLNLKVSSGRAIIDWDRFDIGATNTVSFSSGTPTPSAYTVLNRVSGALSTIQGTLTASDATPLANIFLINENGISLSGANAKITNLNSFFGSALPLSMTDTDFMNAGTAASFQFGKKAGANAGVITIDAGATIGTAAAHITGPVVLVAPKISANGSIFASGDVGLVVAQAATVDLDAGSNIGVTISAGTTISGNGQLAVAGTVNGANIYLAGVSKGDVTNALLNVSADLTATSTAHGIVLSAGASAPGVALSLDSGTTPGAGGVTMTGTASGLIQAAATGDVTITPATGGVTIGSVSSGGSLSIVANGVTIGSGTLSAKNAVSVQSTSATTGITSTGNSIITANAANAGTAALTLRSAGAIDAGGVSLTAGAGKAVVTLDDPTASVALANVSAASLVTSGLPGAGLTFASNGNVSLGDVHTTNAIAISTTTAASAGAPIPTLKVGSVVADKGGISLHASGDLMLGGGATTPSPTSTAILLPLDAGNIAITSEAAVKVTGSVQSIGSLVISGKSATLGAAGQATSYTANGALSVISTGAGITLAGTPTLTAGANASGATLLLDSDGAIDGAGASLIAGKLAANGTLTGAAPIQIRLGDTSTAGQAVTLGSVTGASLTSVKAGLLPNSYVATDGTGVFKNAGAISLGAVTLANGIDVETTAGTLSIVSALSSGGGVRLDSSGQLTLGVTGETHDFKGRDDVTLRSSGADILGNGTLAVTSGTDGSGVLTLDAAGSIKAATTTLVAGTNASRTAVQIKTGGNLALGNVTGLSLLSVTGTPGSYVPGTLLKTGGNLDFGDVLTTSATTALDIETTAGTLTIGSATSKGNAVTLQSSDALTLGDTSLSSSADGKSYTIASIGLGVTLKGSVQSGAALTVRAGGSGIIGTGAITLSSAHDGGAGALTLDAAGTIIAPQTTVIGGSTIPAGSSLTPSYTAPIQIHLADGSGPGTETITLGDISGLSLQSVDAGYAATGVGLQTLGAVTLGNVKTARALSIVSDDVLSTPHVGMTIASAISTQGSVTLQSNGLLTLGKTILSTSADGMAYSITSVDDAVTLLASVRSGGALTIKAGGGGITGTGTLTLSSAHDGGTGALTLDSFGAILAPNTSLIGGGTTPATNPATPTAAVQIHLADTNSAAAQEIHLGDITATQVIGVGAGPGYTPDVDSSLKTAGDITLGDVRTTLALDLRTNGGAMVIGNAVSANAGVNLHARDMLTLGGGNMPVSSSAKGFDFTLSTDAAPIAISHAINGGQDLSILTEVAGTRASVTSTSPLTALRDVTVQSDSFSLTSITAGDDIVLSATGLGASTVGSLTATGLGNDSEGGDDTATATLGEQNLAGSNIVVNSKAAVAITGTVNAVGTTTSGVFHTARDYRVTASDVTLGTSTSLLSQKASGKVIVTATNGAISLLSSGTSGQIVSNAKNGAIGDKGRMALSATSGVNGATIALATLATTGQMQAGQASLAVSTTGGSITLGSVSGGAVTLRAPVAISVPLVTASGNVTIAGVSASPTLNDTATIDPVTITATHAGVTNEADGSVVRAAVTVSGGRGASVTTTAAAGGKIGTLQVLADTGDATLTRTSTNTDDIQSILVESQTGAASIGGNAATSVGAYAGSIAVYGRQATASATIDYAKATTSIIAVGNTALVHKAVTASGDIRVAGVVSAALDNGNAGGGIDVTAVASGDVATGTATLGTSAGTDIVTAKGRITAAGTAVTVTRGTQVSAGDDLVLAAQGALGAQGATLSAGVVAGTDGQASDATSLSGAQVTSTHSTTGYAANYGGGTGATVYEIGDRPVTSFVSGATLDRFTGHNAVLSGLTVDFSTAGAAMGALTTAGDARIEAGQTATLGQVTAGRDIVAQAGVSAAGDLVAQAKLQAGDDLLLVAGKGMITATAATLMTTGQGSDSEALDSDAALDPGGTAIADPTGTGNLVGLRGSTIVVAASGTVDIANARAATDMRAAGSFVTIGTALAKRDVLLIGGGVKASGLLEGGDDVIVAARDGSADLATIQTDGTGSDTEASSTTSALDLSGNTLLVAGSSLTRLDRSSITVAASKAVSITGQVTSAGRYTVIGYAPSDPSISLNAVTLGGAGVVTQSAKGDIRIEVRGTAAAPANLSLAGPLALTSNSDASGTSDGMTLALGHGDIIGPNAVLTTLASPLELLAGQGAITTADLASAGVRNVTLATVSAPSATIAANNSIHIDDGKFDAGFTLASRTADVSLGTATVLTDVTQMTVSQKSAIDLALFGETGASLTQTTGASDGLLRDITVSTTGGTAQITNRASAHDDIVVASDTGNATAGTLVLQGSPSDSEGGHNDTTIGRYFGNAVEDAYDGENLTNLGGANIIVSGGAPVASSLGVGASLHVAQTIIPTASVRVITDNGTASADSINSPEYALIATNHGLATAGGVGAGSIAVSGGSAYLGQGIATNTISVIAGTGSAKVGVSAEAGSDLVVQAGADATLTKGTSHGGNIFVSSDSGTALVSYARAELGNLSVRSGAGNATATDAGAKRNILITATSGLATLTTGTAGQDIRVNGGNVLIGTATAGDDLVAVATAGTVTATKVTTTGATASDEGDAVPARDAYGAVIADPSVSPAGTVLGLGGSQIVLLASGNIAPGVVDAQGGARLASLNGTINGTSVKADTTAVVASAKAITLDIVNAGTVATLKTTGGAIGLGDLSAGGAATLSATGDVHISRTLSAASAGVTAGADIRVGDAAASNTIVFNTTTGGATLDAKGKISIAQPLTVKTDLTATTTTGAQSFAAIMSGGLTKLSGKGPIGVTGLLKTGGAATLDGSTITVGALNATGAATLTGASDVKVIGTAQTGDFVATSASGAIQLASLTATGTVSMKAKGAIGVTGQLKAAGATGLDGSTITLGSLDAAGATTLTGVNDVKVIGAAQTGNLVATSGSGAIQLASLTATGGVSIKAKGAIGVTGQLKAAGAAGLDGSTITLGSLDAAGATTLTGVNDVKVIGAAQTGNLVATSGSGAIQLASLTATGTISMTAAGGVGVTGAASSAGSFQARGGSVTLGSLNAGGPAGLTGTTGVTVVGAAGTAGSFDATTRNGSIMLGSLNAAGVATLNATKGLISSGVTSAGGAFAATSNGAMTFASLTAPAATLSAGGMMTISGKAALSGALIATTGAAFSAGSVSASTARITAQTGMSVTGLATATSGAFTATTASGGIAIQSLASSGDTTLTATGGSVALGGSTVATAAQTGGKLVIVSAGATSVIGAVSAGSDYRIMAGAPITLGGGKAANGANGLQRSATEVTLQSPDLILVGSENASLGSGVTLQAGNRIQLDVTGAPPRVALGNNLVASTQPSYSLSNEELGRISAPVLEINADYGLAGTQSRDVDIGVAALPAVTSAFAVQSKGDITLYDTLSFASTDAASPRSLTLGGAIDGAASDLAGNPVAHSIRVIAIEKLNNSTSGTGGQIDAAHSQVTLRADYIALGVLSNAGRAFLKTLLPAGGTPLTVDQVRQDYFANANSSLYTATPPYSVQTPGPQYILSAGALVLAPTQWALVQNTGLSSQVAGGINVDTLSLVKLASADPIVALFGSIAGKNGVVAPVSVKIGDLDGISPNNVRINGCIALQSSSCILTGVTLPLINLTDPSDELIVTDNSDLGLPIELVTGTSNELLWNDDDDDKHRDERPNFDPTAPGVSTTDTPPAQTPTETH